MTSTKANIVYKARIVVQVIFTCLFFYLFFASGDAISNQENLTSYFFYFDPLFPLMHLLTTGEFLIIFMFSTITIISALLFGRFFCGWICPLGTINHFFSWLFQRFNNTKQEVNTRFLRTKYILLIILFASAVFGTNLAGWLDPFSLLTRSTAALGAPAGYLTNYPFEIFSNEDFSTASRSVEITDQKFLENLQHTTSQPYFITGIFIFILAMNFYKRRFYCNAICPLGAFLGLISRLSLFRVISAPGCISCKQCNSGCTFDGNPEDEFIKSECTVCFNCVVECPSNSVDYKFLLPIKMQERNIDLGRRRIIGAAITGVVAAALPQSSVHAKSNGRHKFLRPPGSINESAFIDKCLRCGQCVKSCPTNFIQPAFAETGFGGIWTPVLNAEAGFCIFECNRCTHVCPSNTLVKLSMKEKQGFKLGTAVIDKNKCYTYADGMNCTICQEVCPTPEKAIQFREVETWNFQGKLKTVKQIFVKPQLCIGCGICVNACPRTDQPGIVLTAGDEIRERVTGNI